VTTARAIGAILGSAVGDALGAPFEFGPEGAFTERFPTPGHGGEMCGGGGWDPGEATDDTQMHVPLPGFGGRILHAAELTDLARELAS